MRILFALWLLSVVAHADSKTEADLRARLTASEASRASLLRVNADLTKQLKETKASVTGASSTLIAGQKSQAKTHAEEKGAVTQQQDESAQTLFNTNQSVRAASEAEKQLIRIENDIKSALKVLVILVVVVLCFTGAILFHGRRQLMVIPTGKIATIPAEMEAPSKAEESPAGKGD